MHFLPFNPVGKRTAITYIDSQGNWHRCSKGAPEQVRDSFHLQILCVYVYIMEEGSNYTSSITLFNNVLLNTVFYKTDRWIKSLYIIVHIYKFLPKFKFIWYAIVD